MSEVVKAKMRKPSFLQRLPEVFGNVFRVHSDKRTFNPFEFVDYEFRILDSPVARQCLWAFSDHSALVGAHNRLADRDGVPGNILVCERTYFSTAERPKSR